MLRGITTREYHRVSLQIRNGRVCVEFKRGPTSEKTGHARLVVILEWWEKLKKRPSLRYPDHSANDR